MLLQQLGWEKGSADWDVIDTFVRIFHTHCQQKAPDVRGGHAVVDQAHMCAVTQESSPRRRMCVLEKWSWAWPAGPSTLVKAISSHVETRYGSTACLSSIVIYRSFSRSICVRDCDCTPPELRAKSMIVVFMRL